MSGTTSRTKAAALARVQALMAGTKLHFPNGTFTLGNTAFTTASLVQEFQNLVDAMLKRDAGEASVKDVRNALRDTAAKVDPLMRNFRRFLLVTFATATQTLADFGLEPPRAHKPLPADKRAAATAKMRATRTARGTASKKQKLAVKGDVTGVVVTPVTQPVAKPSPTPPASNAAGAPSPAPPK